MRVSIALCGLALALALGAGACSDNNKGAVPGQAPASAADALQRAQAAIEKTGSYTLTVEQSNFVLPQWGGADAGTVKVSGRGDIAFATLVRTGEPGASYGLTLFRNQTFFQRSTCDSIFRIPGGGPDVLRPYLFGLTSAIGNATSASYAAGSTTAIRATVQDLGDVVIDLDPTSGRPVRITGRSNGQPLVWSFTSWDTSPLALGGDGRMDNAIDRGPGGIPC